MKDITSTNKPIPDFMKQINQRLASLRRGKMVTGQGNFFNNPVPSSSTFGTQPSFTAGADIRFSTDSTFYHPVLSRDFLELPMTKAEKHTWYRLFYKADPIVGRAIDIHSEIPLSKLTFTMPKSKDEKLNRKVLHFFEEMAKELNLFRNLLSIAHEFWLFGNCYIFLEYDEENKKWSRLVVLNPDYVEVKSIPYTDKVRIEMIPDPMYTGLLASGDYKTEYTEDFREGVPPEILEAIEAGQNIVFDSDPSTGSYVYHLARKKSPYADEGSSILERLLRTLLYRDKLRQAQTQIASRNMTPKRVIVAEQADDFTIEALRTQVDLALMDPDFSIVTNFALDWQEIGVRERLLDIVPEFEYLTDQMLIGLGLPKGLLTGEGTYTGERISLEVMNISYMLFREELTLFIEEGIFKPLAEFNDFWGIDEFGHKILLYPGVRFSRLSLRDYSDMFADLFNLYQKGSISIRPILEILNIDPEDAEERVKEDLFTVFDPNTNQLMNQVYNALAEKVVEQTDILDKVAKNLGLVLKPPAPEAAPEGEAPGAGEEMPGMGAEVSPGQEGLEPTPLAPAPPARSPLVEVPEAAQPPAAGAEVPYVPPEVPLRTPLTQVSPEYLEQQRVKKRRERIPSRTPLVTEEKNV